MLHRGQALRTDSGLSCVVGDELGEGGQGAVSRARLASGEEVAVKWYWPRWRATDPGLRARLQKIIEISSPSDRFVWPQELVFDERGEFGYRMRLCDPRFTGMTALLAGKVNPSFMTIVTTAIELAHNFHLLHAEGLSYQDISDGNVRFDPDGGRVEIVDNDNCNVNGVPAAVGGTPDYMAPEIVLGSEAAARGGSIVVPSANTDRYSLAVLIFQLLMVDHPLRGAAELRYHALGPAEKRALYAEHPIFIYDPDDTSNRPVPGRHDAAILYWPLYPGFIHELFVQAFTAGLRDPGQRIWESTWRKRLVRLRNAILVCESCAQENFYDAERSEPGVCWSCRKTLPEPHAILRINKNDVILNSNTQLFEHHLDPQRCFHFEHVLASVTHHPTQPNVWGLRNDSSVPWTVISREGLETAIAPQRVARLELGLRIDFGSCVGEVVEPSPRPVPVAAS